MPLFPKASTSDREPPLLGCATRGYMREGDQAGALGPDKALTLPAQPPGQPAADTHGSGHKGACLGGGTHGFTLQDTRRNTLW